MSERIHDTNFANRVAAAAAMAGAMVLTAEGVAQAQVAKPAHGIESIQTDKTHDRWESPPTELGALEHTKNGPNITSYFPAGTKIFSTPYEGKKLIKRVPEGDLLEVNPGPVLTDADGKKFIGFTQTLPKYIHNRHDMVKYEVYAPLAAANKIVHNPGARTVRLRIDKEGHIYSPDASNANSGIILDGGTKHIA